MEQLNDLKQVEVQRIDIGALNSVQMQHALKFSNDRYNAFAQYINQTIDGTQKFFDNESQTLAAVTEQLTKILSELQQRQEGNQRMLQQVQISNKEISDEQMSAQNELSRHQESQAPNNEPLKQKITDLKNEIKKLSADRQQIADSLDCGTLSSIQMKNRDKDSIVNEIFKWALLFLYKDQIANYYWPNFKQEAFGNDKGEDFKARCGRVKAIDIKKDEQIKTDIILSIQDQVIADPLLNGQQRVAVNDIFKIVKIVREINLKGQEIHKLEKDIIQKDVENQRIQVEIDRTKNRINVLQERVSFQDQISQFYQKLIKNIDIKIRSYHQASNMNNQFVMQLKNEYKSIDLTKYNSGTGYVAPQQETKQEYQETPVQEEKPVEIYENDQNVVTQKNEQPVEAKNELEEFNAIPQRAPETEIMQTRKDGGCQGCQVF